jgi:hypothetical protein
MMTMTGEDDRFRCVAHHVDERHHDDRRHACLHGARSTPQQNRLVFWFYRRC